MYFSLHLRQRMAIALVLKTSNLTFFFCLKFFETKKPAMAQHNSDTTGHKEKKDSDIVIATPETRDEFDCFKRVDSSFTSYETNKIIFFGVGLLVIPVRLILIFTAFFIYTVVLRVLEILNGLKMFTMQTYTWLCRVLVQVGGRCILFFFGVHWIKRHYVTDSEMQTMLKQIRGTTDAENDIDEKYKKKAPLVVIANHTCYFDPVIALAEYNECSIIARAGTENSPIIGALTRQLKCFYTGRGGIVEQMKERAKLYYEQDPDFKTRILVFPEATTSSGTHVLRFHEGSFRLGVPIQPMMIRFPYTNFNPCWSGIDDLPYFVSLFSQFTLPMEIVHFPPYYPTAAEIADPVLFAENVRKVMVEGCNLRTAATLSPMKLSPLRYERTNEKKSHGASDAAATNAGEENKKQN